MLGGPARSYSSRSGCCPARSPGPAPIAGEALKHIAEFYTIEKDIRGRSADERRLVRQQKSRPPAEAFERWLRAKLALIS